MPSFPTSNKFIYFFNFRKNDFFSSRFDFDCVLFGWKALHFGRSDILLSSFRLDCYFNYYFYFYFFTNYETKAQILWFIRFCIPGQVQIP